MKLGAQDLPKLRVSLATLVLMVVLGAASILYSRERGRTADAAVAAAQRERSEIDSKLKRVRSEEHEIRQKAALFNALQSRGVIGEEHRLEWVELLEEIRARHRLLELRYEIAPQHALDKSPTGNLSLYASTMKLQLKLLHEEDLTRLLDDLRQQAGALIQVKNCRVARLPRVASDSAIQGMLQAECTIDWLTVRDSGKGKEGTK